MIKLFKKLFKQKRFLLPFPPTVFNLETGKLIDTDTDEFKRLKIHRWDNYAAVYDPNWRLKRND